MMNDQFWGAGHKIFQSSVNPLKHQYDRRQKYVKIIVGDQRETHLIGRTGVDSKAFEVIEAGGWSELDDFARPQNGTREELRRIETSKARSESTPF